MTCNYSSISSETGLVTHFSGYNYTLLKRNVVCFKLRFSLYRNILQKQLFLSGYTEILNKFATAVCFLCFKKQTLEILLYVSAKLELP